MKSRCLRSISLVAMLLAVSSGPLAAEETGERRPVQIDDYFTLKWVGSPVVSPDGRWVAYTVSSQDLEKDSRGTRVWMAPVVGGDPLPMTAEGASAWSPRWSADGKHLSFVAMSKKSDSSQVFTLDLRGGERVQLTNVAGGVEGYEWSPDGTKLVLVIRDSPPEQEEPGPWVIDRLKFKADYVGYLNRLRGHLFVFDIETGGVTQITSGDYEDY